MNVLYSYLIVCTYVDSDHSSKFSTDRLSDTTHWLTGSPRPRRLDAGSRNPLVGSPSGAQYSVRRDSGTRNRTTFTIENGSRAERLFRVPRSDRRTAAWIVDGTDGRTTVLGLGTAAGPGSISGGNYGGSCRAEYGPNFFGYVAANSFSNDADIFFFDEYPIKKKI